MHLAGQGKWRRGARRGPDAGYAMAALIIGITVMAVMMTVVMPVWKQMVRREKEEEMVFRGEQIAHSIGMFQRKFANAYPPTLDVLVEQKFLRKKYKDPITNEDFVPLTQAQGQGQAQAATPGGRATAGRGQQQPQPAQPGRGTNPFAGATTPGAAVGGIIGVTSKSTDTSIRLYKGRSHYNEWAFVLHRSGWRRRWRRGSGAGRRGRPGTARPGTESAGPNSPFPNTSPFPGPGGPPGRATDAVHSARVVLLADRRRRRSAIPLPGWSRARTITSRRVKTTGRFGYRLPDSAGSHRETRAARPHLLERSAAARAVGQQHEIPIARRIDPQRRAREADVAERRRRHARAARRCRQHRVPAERARAAGHGAPAS